MAIKFQVTALDYQQLKRDANAVSANQPETIPWPWYDSQDFASNWTNVTFYSSPQSDPTLGNIQQANTLSADQYFRVFAITLDWLIAPSSRSSGAPAIVDDLIIIQNSARALFNFSMSQKQYAQTPIHNLHSSGGIFVNYQLGTPAGSGVDNYAMNWMPDGGWWVGGAWVLGPRQSFQCWIQGVAAALTATRKGRITMHGALSRKVL